MSWRKTIYSLIWIDVGRFVGVRLNERLVKQRESVLLSAGSREGVLRGVPETLGCHSRRTWVRGAEPAKQAEISRVDSLVLA